MANELDTVLAGIGLLGQAPQSGLLPREEIPDAVYMARYLVPLEGMISEARIPTKGDALTIGYGHTGPDVVSGMTITEPEAMTLLMKDINKRLPEIRKAIPNFDSYPQDIKAALFGEWYRGSLGQSKETQKLIRQGKYLEASKEFLNNDEYRNAKKRGREGIRPRMEAAAAAIKRMGQYGSR